MMKQPILIAALTALSISLTAAPARAQFFQRACPAGACPTASAYSYNRVRIAQNQRVYSPFSYQTAVAPCERVGACAELVNNAPQPCDPVETTVETVQPCEPAQTVQPCEPVQTVEPCEPVAECVNGACPIQTVEPCDGVAEKVQIGACPTGACPLRTAAKTVVAKTFETLALARINATRARYGRPALRLNRTLETRAYYQAQYCASVGTLRHASGVAEILAQSSSFDGAIGQWLSSAPHCALMLNTSFTEAGAAFYTDAYGRVWCAVQFR